METLDFNDDKFKFLLNEEDENYLYFSKEYQIKWYYTDNSKISLRNYDTKCKFQSDKYGGFVWFYRFFGKTTKMTMIETYVKLKSIKTRGYVGHYMKVHTSCFKQSWKYTIDMDKNSGDELIFKRNLDVFPVEIDPTNFTVHYSGAINIPLKYDGPPSIEVTTIVFIQTSLQLKNFPKRLYERSFQTFKDISFSFK